MGIKHSYYVHLISEACTWHAHVEDKNVQSEKSRNQGKYIDRYGTSHMKTMLITYSVRDYYNYMKYLLLYLFQY